MGERIEYEDTPQGEAELYGESSSPLLDVAKGFEDHTGAPKQPEWEGWPEEPGDELEAAGYDEQALVDEGYELEQGGELPLDINAVAEYASQLSPEEQLQFVQSLEPWQAEALLAQHAQQTAEQEVAGRLDQLAGFFEDRHAYQAQRQAMAEQQVQAQLAQGEEEAARIVAAGDVQGLDQETVRIVMDHIFDSEHAKTLGHQQLQSYVAEVRDEAIRDLRQWESMQYALGFLGSRGRR